MSPARLVPGLFAVGFVGLALILMLGPAVTRPSALAAPPTVQPAFVAPPVADPEEPPPEAPKLGPDSELTALTPRKTLFLEKAGERRRVHLLTEVCLREGPLEVFLCKKGTKEHEAILRTDVDARFVHAALVAAGLKPGTPVQYVDPATGDDKYKPATGAKVGVSVSYKLDGQVKSHPAQEWVLDVQAKKPMPHQWVFAGSRFVKNPERPADPDYYCANNGEVIGVSNFPDSMLDVPVPVSGDNDKLAFAAWTEKLPPLAAKVWVTLEAAK